MRNCDHKATKVGFAKRKFLGETFRAKAAICKECGAELWDHDVQGKFNLWLTRLHSKKRGKFQIQPAFAANVRECLKKMALEFPGSKDSSIVRAMTFLYLEAAQDRSLLRGIESIYETDTFAMLQSGKKTTLPVGFNPMGIVAVHGWGELMGMTPAKVVEEATLRILAVYLDVDKTGRKIWSEVKEELTRLLRAA